MVVQVLADQERFKLDRADDALFYAEPRFVHHLDGAFRARLTALYRQRIPPCAVVLDLMSSWVSHLPADVSYERVIGHGLNGQELAANPRLRVAELDDELLYERQSQLPAEVLDPEILALLPH